MTMQDGMIDLSFGPDSVKPDEYKALDEAIYPLTCSNVEVKPTAAGEQMVVLEWTVTGDVRPGAKIRNDNLVIPGAARKAQDPDKWNMMMNMLRDRLEAITGKSWDQDNMKLNPYSEFGGKNIRAIVKQVAYGYWKDGENGREWKAGVGNEIFKYLRPDDTSTTFTPGPPVTPPPPPGQADSQSQAPAQQAAPQQGGGFSI